MNKYGSRLLEIMAMDTVQNGELTLSVRNWCGMLGTPDTYWENGYHLLTKILTPAAKSIEAETGRAVTITPNYTKNANGKGKRIDTVSVKVGDVPVVVEPDTIDEDYLVLRIFSNDQFGRVRTIANDDGVWFCGVDVAACLGYKDTNSAVVDHVDKEDKTVFSKGQIAALAGRSSNSGEFLIDTPNRGATFINESGVYSLIFDSRLESAQQFKKWVTHDVLPSIRKHGAYLTPQKIEEVLLNPDTIIKLATQIKEEQQKNALLTKENLALTGSTLEWNKKDFVVAAVNRLATAMPSYHSDVRFKQAWSRFKTEMLHKHSINLESRLSHLRQTSKHPSKVRMMDVFEGDIADMAVSSITAMCREADVDISDLLQNIPA